MISWMNTNRLDNLLRNPVYHGLVTGDRKLALGTDKVKYFDEQVSPFAGFEDGYENGFEELHDLLPEGRMILYATPGQIETPKGWQLLVAINGLQMIFA